MTFDNATPRPWAVHPKAPNEVVDTNGYLIFEVPSGYTEEDARDASADAALIVAAVNSYNPDREALIAELVGALEPFAAIPIKRSTEWGEQNEPWPDDKTLVVYDGAPITVGSVRAALAALSKSRGQA
jgi:hypothetical protein